jgi:hypothetical protein
MAAFSSAPIRQRMLVLVLGWGCDGVLGASESVVVAGVE